MNDRFAMRRPIPILLLLGLLTGCDGEGADGCVEPLTCEGGCMTLDEAIAAQQSPDDPCSEVCAQRVYRCDGLTVVSEGHLLGGEEQFFDAAGRLVARYAYTDYPAYACGFDGWFGARITCGSCADDDGPLTRDGAPMLALAACPPD